MGCPAVQNLVINYDLPRTPKGPDAETYLHRIGRTGRFGKKGISIVRPCLVPAHESSRLTWYVEWHRTLSAPGPSGKI